MSLHTGILPLCGKPAECRFTILVLPFFVRVIDRQWKTVYSFLR